MKLALLVMGMPWLLVTDSGPDYSSQQFSTFLSSWRISHSFWIPYYPQGQGIIERTNHSLKNELAWVSFPESKRYPHLALIEVLFHMKLCSFNEKGLSPTYKH
jgi:transposase InsO family protein